MIPQAVSKVLENYHNETSQPLTQTDALELVDRHQVPASQIVKMVLMADSLGRMQVMVPADCLLDVDRLNKSLGRTLEALPDEDVDSLSARYSLQALPAIPDITGLPAVIDQRVKLLETVYVEAGEDNKLIKMSQDLFSVMQEKASEALFAVPLEDINYNLSCPEQDLEQIKQAIEKFTSLRIRQRLEDTLELPPLPQSAHDIIKLRSNPDAGSDELSDIVERDPSLSAQVVSWASSSFYNAPGKIRSVHDAIVRVLGFDMVMNLAMGLALGKTLKIPEDQVKGYAPYWHRAMWMALGSTVLTTKMEPANRPGFGLIYLSGLLHNFGQLVLGHVFPPHYSLICRHVEANPHLDSSYIEHHLLGITREQVGGQLMSVWNMPEEVIAAIRHQKNPHYNGEHSEYANVLSVVQSVLSELGILNEPAIEIGDDLYERIDMTREQAFEALEQLLEKKEDVDYMANTMGR